MDLTTFYATVSAAGLTLLGLWWVVVDKHPEWFESRATARMAYAVSLHFMLPATASLLSMVAPDKAIVWKVVFALAGISGFVASLMVARTLSAVRRSIGSGALLVAMPVYVVVVLVALFPGLSDVVSLKPLQVEAFLVAIILLLGMNAVWFVTHPGVGPSEEKPLDE